MVPVTVDLNFFVGASRLERFFTRTVTDSTLPLADLLKYRTRLLAFVRGRVGDVDLAEDILQEALLRALRNAPAIKDEERLLAWFYRVLRNAIIDSYRRKGTDERRTIQNARLLEADGEYNADAEPELCECFRELLPALKPEYREMIEALELGGEAPEAAAARLGIEPGNLKVRRHRARRQLRERLEETCRLCARHGCLDCTCKSGQAAQG